MKFSIWRSAVLLNCMLCLGCTSLNMDDHHTGAGKPDQTRYRILWPNDKPIRSANRMAVAEHAGILALAGKRYGIHFYSIHTRNYLDQLPDPGDAELAKDYPSNRGVYALLFSPDERWLISGDEASQVKIWDVAQKKLRTTLHANAGRINSLSLSGDGRLLAVGGESGAIQVWDLSNNKKVVAHAGMRNEKFNNTVAVDQIALVPNRDRLIISSGGFLYWWDYRKDKNWQRFPGQQYAEYYQFTLSGSGRFLSASELLWNLQTGNAMALLPYHNKDNYSFQSTFFSRDEQALFANDSEGKLRVFDPQTGAKQAKWHGRERAIRGDDFFILADDRRMIAFNSQAQSGQSPVHYHDLQSDQELFPEQPIATRAPVRKNTMQVEPIPVVLSPDGKVIVTGNRIRSAQNLNLISDIDMPSVNPALRHIRSVALSNDNKLYAACINNGNEAYVGVWDVASQANLRKLPAKCTQVMISPDAGAVLFVDDALILHKLDIASGKLHFDIDQYKSSRETKADVPRSVTMIKTANRIALAINTKFEHAYVALHDWQTGKQLAVIRHTDFHWIGPVAMSPDMKLAALVSVTGSQNARLHVIDIRSGKPRWHTDLPKTCCYALAFTPDNQRLYGASDNRLHVWNVVNGRPAESIRIGWEKPMSRYHSLAISPDGKRLYVADQIWDLVNKRQILEP